MTQDLEEWIQTIKKSHPDLKGHSICPFAKANTYKIVKCSINDIKPLDEEFGVVIFIVEDDLEIEYGYQKIEELNQKYPKYKFFDDFRDEPSFINKVQTNNGLYNLILYQDSEFLTKMRKILAKTNYYDLWDDEYLKKILEDDYEVVQSIRNK
jgi:Fe-S-cluster containining protein